MQLQGQEFQKWSRVRIVRGLKEICGSFEMDYVDEGRLAATLNDLVSPPPYFRAVQAGFPCTLKIDGEAVLQGFVGRVKGHQDASQVSATITGKDICGDLVDCAAAPNGPAEYRNISLTQFAQRICAPFKIGVQAQTDVGASFPILAMSPHEKAMAAMEKAARQRGVLLVSDGVANLLLTTGGSSAAPDNVTVGVNAAICDFEDDWEHRFSDIYVKGQTAAAAGNHAGRTARITPATAPGVTAPVAGATAQEAAGIVMTGHARDTVINRWRPDVRMVRTQSGSSTVQQQAEWHVRVDRGLGKRNSYTMQDWRAGPNNALWRPNQLTALYDPYAGIDDTMLIETVEYLYDAEGSRTVLHIVGPSAYDRINEPARARPRHGGRR